MFIEGGGRWEPDPEPDPPRRRQRPKLPWRPLAWIVGLCWVLALGGEAGGIVAYASVLFVVTTAAVLVERAAARSSWGGMRDHRQ